jgi:phosphatidate cytidylyltransferase
LAASNLTQRVIIAAIFGPVFAALFWVGGQLLLVGLCAVVGLGTWEYGRIQQHKGLRPWTWLGVVASLVFCVWVFQFGTGHLVLLILLTLLSTLCLSLWRRDDGFRVGDATSTLTGVLYVGFLGSFALLVRGEPAASAPQGAGRELALLVLVGIWVTDIGAYFAGRFLGKRHPFPHISPKKTGAGLVGGLVAALAAVAVGHRYIALASAWECAVLGLLIFAGAVVGDLFESVLKRDAGVKDSSTLIPGHGGVLDRFDSFLFVFPAVYLYLKLLEAIGT